MLDTIKKLKTHNDIAQASDELYLQIYSDESGDILTVCGDEEIETFNSITDLNECLDDLIADVNKTNG